MIKYIKMTASSNFGNMFSVLAASALLPFLPMSSLQLLVLNLLYEISCIAIPWDNVDEEFIAKPRKWDASSVGSFMIWIGPTSSIFDFTTYIFMYFVFCPLFISKGILFNDLAAHYSGAKPCLCLCDTSDHDRHCRFDSDSLHGIRKSAWVCGFACRIFCIFDSLYSAVYDIGNQLEKGLCSSLWRAVIGGVGNDELERNLGIAFRRL